MDTSKLIQIIANSSLDTIPDDESETKKIEEANKKKPDDSKKAPVKQYFTVKLEVIAPVTVSYRILAETPEQALELVDKTAPNEISKPILSKMKKIKVSIYNAGTSLLRYSKKF